MLFLFVCLYFCMFVTLDVQDRRGLDVQQRIMSPFVEQFQCGFRFFSQKETSIPAVCRGFNYITRWRHNVRRNRENFEKFTKTEGKVCEHDFDHLGAAYNKGGCYSHDGRVYTTVVRIAYKSAKAILKTVKQFGSAI